MRETKLKQVLIVCGGQSAEHEISIISARHVLQALDKEKFEPVLVFISQTGTWWYQQDWKIISGVTVCDANFKQGHHASLTYKNNETYLLLSSAEDNSDISEIKIDVAFPVLHGPRGEDGTIQGLFEIMNLPYVGSDSFSSSVNMDKDLFKKVVSQVAPTIPLVPSITLSNNSVEYSNAVKQLGSKILFIKPAVMGSSVGITRVTNEKEYLDAIEEAFKYGTKVLIEKAVSAREIECAVLGTDKPKASCLGEIRPSKKHAFYSYEAKYLDPDGAALSIPADVPADITKKIQAMAVEAFVATGCAGMARVDFFLTDDNTIYLNEINTIPGFTQISMYPKLWEASGVASDELITRLIEFSTQ